MNCDNDKNNTAKTTTMPTCDSSCVWLRAPKNCLQALPFRKPPMDPSVCRVQGDSESPVRCTELEPKTADAGLSSPTSLQQGLYGAFLDVFSGASEDAATKGFARRDGRFKFKVFRRFHGQAAASYSQYAGYSAGSASAGLGHMKQASGCQMPTATGQPQEPYTGVCCPRRPAACPAGSAAADAASRNLGSDLEWVVC